MQETLIVLVVFVAFAVLFQRLRLGTVLGFLIGGMVVGPWGLGLVHELERVRLLGELGVVFLLFNLGLELKLERFRLFGARVYALAGAQVLATAAAIGGVAVYLDLAFEPAIIIGGALALSSTAVVLQVLGDLGRTLTQLGRLAIAILLVQDVTVGPLLVLVNVLSGAGGAIALGLLTALAKGAVVVFLVVGISRYLLPLVLEYIAAVASDEVFTAATLLVVLGASFATEEAGLSTALGAFVAGLMVADSQYRHQIAADIAPLRGLLLGLFFLTVGMTIDLDVALANLDRVVAIAVGLLLLKAVVLYGLARALRYSNRLALPLGGLLAQGSEFAFVLLALAAQTGLLVGPGVQWLTVAIALSMAITALAAAVGRRQLDRLEGEASASLTDLDARTAELHNHIVIAGFGQVGMALARHLISLDIPVLVLDYDAKRVRSSQAHRLPVYFGNAARADVLRAAHVGRARLMIVALPSRTSGERVVRLVRALYPGLRLLARVPDEAGAPEMRAAGANAVVVEGLTTARDLAERAILLYEPDSKAAAES
ncbi:MAG TPA: cation:proton antiporter [Geminicoccaceae bacterium]|nr:cation:proton antiporter [Geminicoccaceae bacterium]